MIVGIVPAAGHARRLQPLATSKELLEVAGSPLIDHVVRRMRAADANEIRVVTRRAKADVVAYARDARLRVVEAAPRSLSRSIARGVAGLSGDDVVLVGFPDSLWWPVEGFRRLRAELDRADAVVGVFRMEEPSRSDVVSLARDGRVVAVDVKPSSPTGDLVWGALAARVRSLRGITRRADPGHHLALLAASGRLRGVRLEDPYVDVGTRDALAAARAWRTEDEARVSGASRLERTRTDRGPTT